MSQDMPEPWTELDDIQLDTVALDGVLGLQATPDASWRAVKSADTGTTLLLRLHRELVTGYLRVTATVTLGADGAPLNGIDLRSIQLARIVSALSSTGSYLDVVAEHLPHAASDPLEMLPPATSTPAFAALVAAQYWAFNATDERKIAIRMARHNGKPLSTVQRWITKARKLGMIPQSEQS